MNVPISKRQLQKWTEENKGKKWFAKNSFPNRKARRKAVKS